MSTEIIKVLDYIGEKVGITIDWTSENVIPYVQELCSKYINYEIATSIAWLVLGVILLVIAIVCFVAAKKVWKQADGWMDTDEEFGFGVLAIMACSALIIGTVIIGYQVMDIIACLTFPEKIILEYVKILMETKS